MGQDINVSVHVCKHTRACVFVYINFISPALVSLYLGAYEHVYIHTSLYLHACMQIHIENKLASCKIRMPRVYLHIYIHTYTYTYIHTYIHL